MIGYNENDQFVVQWLRNLVVAGHIPEGNIDARSIEEIQPKDCAETMHFFAGIGGWAYALRLAGWPDDVGVWTGSCPCQPFSVAGRGAGADDARHLWPAWYGLIEKCRPSTIFGEQVSGPDAVQWLAAVQADLEGIGYAVGRADLSAAGIGAPHIRQRLYWVAHSSRIGRIGRDSRIHTGEGQNEASRSSHISSGLEYSDSQRCRETGREHSTGERTGKRCIDGGTATNGPWSNVVYLPLCDGTARPTKPGIFPLAPRLPERVGLLRGAGNSIVPQLAAVFIRAAIGELIK